MMRFWFTVDESTMSLGELSEDMDALQKLFDNPPEGVYIESFDLDPDKIPTNTSKIYVAGIVIVDTGMQSDSGVANVFYTKDRALNFMWDMDIDDDVLSMMKNQKDTLSFVYEDEDDEDEDDTYRALAFFFEVDLLL